MHLQPFQKRFLKSAFAPGVDTACLSLPRANGKSRLAAYIATRAMTPGDSLFRPGTETILCAASLEQCRPVFGFVREALEASGEKYRFSDSGTRISAVHLTTNTRLRALGSNGRTAMGFVRVPLLIADEPGAWETAGGRLLADAILTAQGKPGSPLKAVFIGTIAPSRAGWWADMVQGREQPPDRHVTLLQGNPKRWREWREIRRCNPLVAVSQDFRRKLLRERDEALRDPRLKARFLSFRLNLPTADESEVLLTVEDWKQVCARPVPPPSGRPIVGIDLGGGRSWSAAVAVWQSGRVEALAVAPGVPELADQERRDRVDGGTYAALAGAGLLRVATGLRVQPAAELWRAVLDAWGRPVRVICDRFRAAELADAVGTAASIEARVSRWSEAAADVRALRKLAADGPLACEAASRAILEHSLSRATVKSDEQGSTRLVKLSNNEARDDVAAALLLAAGAWVRAGRTPPGPGLRSLGLAG